MTDCGNVARYKGALPPRCNGGRGCRACRRKYDLKAVERVLKRLDTLTRGGSGLIAQALSDLHTAALSHGTAVLTHYGVKTRSIRARSRQRLEQAARAHFLAVSAAEGNLDLT